MRFIFINKRNIYIETTLDGKQLDSSVFTTINEIELINSIVKSIKYFKYILLKINKSMK